MIDIRQFITPEEPEIKQLSYQFSSVEEAFVFVRDQIISIPDEQDFWQDPIMTMNRRAGDCEDKGIFLCNILRSMGYDAYVFVFYIPERGENHAVVILDNIIYDPTFKVDGEGLGTGATIPGVDPFAYPVCLWDNQQLIVYDENAYQNLL